MKRERNTAPATARGGETTDKEGNRESKRGMLMLMLLNKPEKWERTARENKRLMLNKGKKEEKALDLDIVVVAAAAADVVVVVGSLVAVSSGRTAAAVAAAAAAAGARALHLGHHRHHHQQHHQRASLP